MLAVGCPKTGVTSPGSSGLGSAGAEPLTPAATLAPAILLPDSTTDGLTRVRAEPRFCALVMHC